MRGHQTLPTRRKVAIQKGCNVIDTVVRTVYIRYGTGQGFIWYEKMFRPVSLVRGGWTCIIREGLKNHD